ncbi:acyltransferase [Microbacterium sp. cx-55]|uniref:acyltransferase family protein n=1 Tax=Microbacterium sp. cx-55 TaxID=2875948 RepID=UPI001CC05654|nr:acyltransferase [Microbacterium sp. cx-55]MBZ4486828.1 acyltransferase [Microbacterium sp. cx-55]UGB35757.1 acyltransferase [Microbacterium sp. cx-55]
MKSAADIDFESFRGARRFPALDGLRAVSILFVLTWHMHDPFWSPFYGALGVTMFFGISGFLITTLLLREEDRNGRVSLKNFYIRRVFRIVPLYFLALGSTAFLVLVAGFGQGGGNFLDRLPLLLTFNGEFAGSGTFSHSWSLGIEEKFYILWPLLAFAVPFIRSRLGQVLTILVPVAAVASFVPWTGYIGIYFPILGGCALAVAMHHRASFAVIRSIANPWFSSVLFVAMLLFPFFERSIPIGDHSHYAHVAFGLVVLLAMPGLLIRGSWQQRLLAVRPIVYCGNLAYAVYLFHPFVVEVVDRLIAPGQSGAFPTSARFVAVFLGSLAVAWVLRVTIEQPFIRVGRKLTNAVPPPDRVEADSARTQPPSRA